MHPCIPRSRLFPARFKAPQLSGKLFIMQRLRHHHIHPAISTAAQTNHCGSSSTAVAPAQK